jgi:acyl-CoA synthetase (NDP forming)
LALFLLDLIVRKGGFSFSWKLWRTTMSVEDRFHAPVLPVSSTLHPLDVFFAPNSVAVFGATEKCGDPGRSLTHKLILNPFSGVVFPINPHHSSVLGVKAYPSLARVPGPVDLAILITPAATVPDILAECQTAKVKAAIVVSTGFADSGLRGKELERKVHQVRQRGSMRVLGMGSFGVACPRRCFYANCASDTLLRGNVGFLTQVVPHKPIILIKSGSDSIDDHVFDEACRSSGVLRVHRFADLFRLASHLSSRPVPRGRRLAILSNARGPAALAADAIRSQGACLAPLVEETVTELAGVLTARWNRQNPIDVGGDSDAERFAHAAAVAARDSTTDALLVLLAPHRSIDPEVAAKEISELAGHTDKPILACWMFEAASPDCLAVLRGAGIPTFHSPESAIRTFGYLWRHSKNLRYLSEIREAQSEIENRAIQHDRAAEVVREVRGTGRTILTPGEVEGLFSAYGETVARKWSHCGSSRAS